MSKSNDDSDVMSKGIASRTTAHGLGSQEVKEMRTWMPKEKTKLIESKAWYEVIIFSKVMMSQELNK